MLAFLNAGRPSANPFQSIKSATAWLETLPALDVMARAQLATQAFERLRDSTSAIDPGTAHALVHVDRALGPDRRKLFRQVVEGSSLGGALQEQIWKANAELIAGLGAAYEAVLDTAFDPDRHGAWKALLPSLAVRALHHYTSDAKLRIGHHETWIPARWRNLHRIYVRATDFGIERVTVSAGDGGQGMHHWTVEREYICALALHLLGSGNLSAAQIDWATGQIRGASARLKLASSPASDGDFVVDLASDAGLVRGGRTTASTTLRFLDTTPMIGCFDATITQERAALDADNATGVVARERVGVLEKMRIAMSARDLGELRRDPRESCEVPARVHVGLSAIYRLRKTHDLADDDGAAGNVIEIRPQRRASYPRAGWAQLPSALTGDTLCATLAVSDHTVWQVADRSSSGLRIVAQGELVPGRALGALIAVRQADVAQWRLGVARRLKRLSAGKTELGVSLIADHFKAVRLFPKRPGAQDGGIEVEGIDTAVLGRGIEALYLPPPSRRHKPVLAKSLIVPSADYAAGRELVLMSPRSTYTLALRSVIEQRGEWCWATLSIVGKQSRAVPTEAPADEPTSAPS